MKFSPEDSRGWAVGLFLFQSLEPRYLFSAAITAQIPTQSISSSGASVDLTQYFDDSEIPAGYTVVDIQTNLAAPNNNLPIVLTDSQTPQTVQNFIDYIGSGEFLNSIIHRSVPGFVLQGGGYTSDGSAVSVFGDVPDESSTEILNNTIGTIAMALSSGPGSATSQWFINLANNDGSGSTPDLDDSSDGGPFTVFGEVIYNGLNTADAIAALPVVDDTANQAWSQLPVLSGTNGSTVASVPSDDLVITNPFVVTGDVLFGSNSSDPNLVSASVTNGLLTLTPQAGSAGTSVVLTVTAEDFGGGAVDQTFNVDVAGTLAAPAGILASINLTHHVNLAWDSIEGTSTYQVFRSTTDDFSTATRIVKGLTSPTYNDATAVPGTVYYYWVRGKNSLGVGSTISTSGYIPLPAPTGVTATDFPHHVAIAWSAVSNALSYQVFRSATDNFSTATRIQAGITTTFFSDTTAVSGQTYFYWVRAKNAALVGLQSMDVTGGLS
ncbi:MAG: peptidylprolyl isomerase [Tepidisphaeraceae bacterium]|jgi:cyclophilin family peptidyl-prolyl cis-trans isomerase